VLVGAHDGGVDHHVLVVVITRQHLENALENPALRPPAEALVDDLPVPETLWQVTPRNAGPISVEDGVNEQAIVRRRAADMAFAAGQKILDPIPLVVAPCIASHRSAPLEPTAHESLNRRFGNPSAKTSRKIERCSAFDSDPFSCHGLPN